MSVPWCKYALESSLLCLNKHFISSALLAITNDFVVGSTWQGNGTLFYIRAGM